MLTDVAIATSESTGWGWAGRAAAVWCGCCLLLAAGAGAAPKTYDVREFGAVGDLRTLDTAAIQKAIDRCHAEGGGTVVLPANREFLSGTLVLRSGVTLEVQKGAMLRGSRDLRDYIKTVPAIASYGVINYSDYALIQAINEKNVGITGAGIIDGDGVAVPGRTGHAHLKTRPYLLRFVGCTDVKVRQVLLRNPNFWTMVYLECDRVHLDGVKVRACNLDPHQPNGDGLDLDGCQQVLVENCDIESEDDGVALKSTSHRPMRDVLFRNNTVFTNLNGLKIGTETHGEIRDVIFRHNRVRFAGRAALTVQCVDGARIENITFEDIVIDETAVPIFLRLGDRGRQIVPYENAVMTYDRPGAERVKTADSPPVGTLRGITFRNIVSRGVKVAQPPKVMARSIGSAISGLPGHAIEDVRLENLDLTYAGGILDRQKTYTETPEKPAAYPNPELFGELPAYALFLRHVNGVRLENVKIRWLEPDHRSALVFDDAHDIRLRQVQVSHDSKGAPAAEFFRGSAGARVTQESVPAENVYQIEGVIPAKGAGK